MNIGEQINALRKRDGLSQDDFANIFNVSRQTVSNWENEKSYPDLEMIIKISDYFNISVDELLKNDKKKIKKIDSQKKKKKQYFILLIILLILACSIIFSLYVKYLDSTSVNFTMKKNETLKDNEIEELQTNIANGYFSVPKDGKLDIHVNGAIDDGKLHVLITDKDNNVYYQLDGQELNDLQTLYFEKDSYIIQIVADDYKEDVISFDYNIEVKN